MSEIRIGDIFEAAAHAINNHDRLVTENKALKDALKANFATKYEALMPREKAQERAEEAIGELLEKLK